MKCNKFDKCHDIASETLVIIGSGNDLLSVLGTKPLLELLLIYCQLHPWEHGLVITQ